jgi:hypothetical protein
VWVTLNIVRRLLAKCSELNDVVDYEWINFIRRERISPDSVCKQCSPCTKTFTAKLQIQFKCKFFLLVILTDL